jgi:hypothetical protein
VKKIKQFANSTIALSGSNNERKRGKEMSATGHDIAIQT